jgi:chromosome segregation ATPase
MARVLAARPISSNYPGKSYGGCRCRAIPPGLMTRVVPCLSVSSARRVLAPLASALLQLACVAPQTHTALVERHRLLEERVTVLETTAHEQKAILADTRKALEVLRSQGKALAEEAARLREALQATEILVEEIQRLNDVNATLKEDREKLRLSFLDLQRQLRDLSQRKQAAESKADDYKKLVERFETVVKALD